MQSLKYPCTHSWLVPSPGSKTVAVYIYIYIYVECPEFISMVKFVDNDVLCSYILRGKPESALLGVNAPFEVGTPYIVAKYREYIDAEC
jgi:hypothetical protein